MPGSPPLSLTSSRCTIFPFESRTAARMAVSSSVRSPAFVIFEIEVDRLTETRLLRSQRLRWVKAQLHVGSEARAGVAEAEGEKNSGRFDVKHK